MVKKGFDDFVLGEKAHKGYSCMMIERLDSLGVLTVGFRGEKRSE